MYNIFSNTFMLFGFSCIADCSQLCFAAKLQTRFVDCDTSPDFISAFERWLSQFHKTSKGDQLSKDILLRLQKSRKCTKHSHLRGRNQSLGIFLLKKRNENNYQNCCQLLFFKLIISLIEFSTFYTCQETVRLDVE